MSLSQISTLQEISQPDYYPLDPGQPPDLMPTRWETLLRRSIFFLLVVFAVCLPFSIKGAERSWRLAFLLWLVQLAVTRRRPFRQPLAAPLLAFVALSGISTALSPDPYLSWDRMKIVCMVLLAILVAQSLQRLSQVRILIVLVMASGLAAAVFTAWQYSYGVGVRVARINPGTALYDAGIHHDDILTAINGKAVHSPEQLVRVVRQIPDDEVVHIAYLRGFPFQKLATSVAQPDFVKSGMGTEWLQFARGKPFRAQGTLGHYVTFAEMLMQLGCMAWALLLAARTTNIAKVSALALTFVAIAIALFATETRAALAGLAVGCFVALLLLTPRRTRIIASAVLLVVAATATLYVQHSRSINWSGGSDAGTHFRLLMWQDGLRLAKEHPWFGVGMDTSRVHFREWHIRGFELYHVQSHFHSTWLQIAVERGLPALVAWLWFVIAYFVLLVRMIKRTRGQSRFATGVATGILAGLAAFTLTAFVHYNLGEEPLAMALYFFLGIALAMDRLSRVPGAFDVE